MGNPTPTTTYLAELKLKYKIDIRPPWIIHEQSLGPGVDHAESYPSSGARNSMMGPRPRMHTCIESRPWPITVKEWKESRLVADKIKEKLKNRQFADNKTDLYIQITFKY